MERVTCVWSMSVVIQHTHLLLRDASCDKAEPWGVACLTSQLSPRPVRLYSNAAFTKELSLLQLLLIAFSNPQPPNTPHNTSTSSLLRTQMQIICSHFCNNSTCQLHLHLNEHQAACNQWLVCMHSLPHLDWKKSTMPCWQKTLRNKNAVHHPAETRENAMQATSPVCPNRLLQSILLAQLQTQDCTHADAHVQRTYAHAHTHKHPSSIHVAAAHWCPAVARHPLLTPLRELEHVVVAQLLPRRYVPLGIDAHACQPISTVCESLGVAVWSTAVVDVASETAKQCGVCDTVLVKPAWRVGGVWKRTEWVWTQGGRGC